LTVSNNNPVISGSETGQDKMNFKIADIKDGGFLGDRVILSALKTMESSNMIKRGDRILISVSGGPDSTFLTYLFYLLRPALNLTLFGFCLDHMTRDGESTKDSLFVKKMYKELDIKLFQKRINVEEWCRLKRISFEKGAREIRLRELMEISEENNIDKIATGHNADDDIETFFMHLLRGAGTRGISGIKPVAGKFIRPLIEISGKDINSYLDRKKISYCVDRTNIENIYFRNRIRNILVPFIEKHFGGSFKRNVSRSLFILKDEDNFLGEYSSSKIKDISSVKKDAAGKSTVFIKIPVSKIMEENIAIRRRIIMSAIEMINGSLENISFKNVDDILGICKSGGESKTARPAGNIRVLKIGSYIYFINISYPDFLPDEFKFFFKKDADIKEREENKKIRVKIGARMRLKYFNLTLSAVLLKYDRDTIKLKQCKNMEAFIDYGKIKSPIVVKRWEKGDKFYPLGMEKEKKLQDFFVDNKIPLHLRKLIPIFIDKEKIIWVGGYRIDNRVKVTGGTSEVLHVKLF